MAVIYNICDIDGKSIIENASIEEIKEINEGDEINIFWNDEGLVERLKEENEDNSNVQIIHSTEIEENEE
tara:strand:+ start:370 stop:579 length:210 start_codon:yes stop_codon:yes gene_type:complete